MDMLNQEINNNKLKVLRNKQKIFVLNMVMDKPMDLGQEISVL